MKDRHHIFHLHVQYAEVEQRRSKAAQHVKYQESFRSPEVLQNAAKHPQREHIEQQMGETAVHEHVGDDLVGTEIHRVDIMQCEKVLDAERTYIPEYLLREEHQRINNDEVFDYRRYRLEPTHSDL